MRDPVPNALLAVALLFAACLAQSIVLGQFQDRPKARADAGARVPAHAPVTAARAGPVAAASAPSTP